MGKVLATNYRFVRDVKDAKEGEPSKERVVLHVGDAVDKLDKDVLKDLEDRGLVVDEDRLTKDGVRIPVGMPGSALLQPTVITGSGIAQGNVTFPDGGDGGDGDDGGDKEATDSTPKKQTAASK